MLMLKNVLDQVQTLFEAELQTKDSWSKSEVVHLYRDCQLKVLKNNLTDDSDSEEDYEDLYDDSDLEEDFYDDLPF